MPTVQTSVGPLWYLDAGEGRPIVLIGGLGAAAATWQTVQRRLSKRWRVICFDNPGVGQSLLPDRTFSLEDIAQAAAELIAHLDLLDVLVVGHSMGGCIAMALAGLHPGLIAGVVLANTLAVPAEDRALHFETLQQKRRELPLEQWYEMFYEQMLTPWRFANEAYRRAIVSYAMMQPQSDESFTRQMQALLAFDGREHLKALQRAGIPTLLLSSDHDRLIPAERTFSMLKNPAGTVLLRDAGHASYIENYRDFCAAVVAFGDRV